MKEQVTVVFPSTLTFQVAGEVAVSDVFNVVRDVVGVRKIGDGPEDSLLNGARGDLVTGTRELPALGTVTLRNGDTGLPL